MGNFNRDKKSFGRKDSGPRQMFHAVCSKCGRDCEIPFKPTGDRPVFCSDCFKSQGGANAGRPGGDSFRKPNFGDKQMFSATCSKCGKRCEVPFKPMPGKSVFCEQCFGNKGGSQGGGQASGGGAGQLKGQLDILNAKLDKILQALSPAKAATAPGKKTALAKIKTKITVKKAMAKKKK